MTTQITGPLTILELRAENVKKISVVRIRPDGKLVQVTGKNGNGKSSVLDAIAMALDWQHSPKPAQPIRKGAKEGRIEIDLGEIKATRVFRESGTTELRLEAKDGSNIRSPQTLLDTLIGNLSFNPLDFMKGDDKAKFDALKAFVPGVDFDKIAAQNETDYAKRTDENRKAKELTAQAAGIMVPDGKWTRIDVTQVVADLEAAELHNNTLAQRLQRRQKAEQDVRSIYSEIEDDRAEIAQLKDRIAEIEDRIARMADGRKIIEDKLAAADPLPDPIDTAALRAKITDAQTVNANAEKAERKVALTTQAEQHTAAAKALTDAMEARREDVAAKIAAAKMPVPGLSLADGKVFLDGVEIRDVNRAEQLKLSIAVAMAANPKLRVIRISEGGNDLDEDAMRVLAQMAEEHGYQVWIERITAAGGPPAVIMEDGHAKEP